MPVRGLFDFDGSLFLASSDELVSRDGVSLVETPDLGLDLLVEPVGGFGLPESTPDLQNLGILGGFFGGEAPSDPATPPPSGIGLLDGLLSGDDDEETPSTPASDLRDWFFNLFGGDDDAPEQPQGASEAPGYWLTVGLLGGRVWTPTEPEAAPDEFNSLILCPADQPTATGSASPAFDLFGH